jgi:hypothetical protein
MCAHLCWGGHPELLFPNKFSFIQSFFNSSILPRLLLNSNKKDKNGRKLAPGIKLQNNQNPKKTHDHSRLMGMKIEKMGNFVQKWSGPNGKIFF